MSRVPRSLLSGEKTPLKRLGAVGALALAAVVLAACVPEPELPGATPSPTASAAEPSATGAPVPSVPEPAPSGSASSSYTPADGEILIVSAGHTGSALEVTAMLPGVSESGGTCTLELPQSGASAEVTGSAGNGVTYCGVMSVTASATEAGTFVVRYTSDTTRAESALTTLEPTR